MGNCNCKGQQPSISFDSLELSPIQSRFPSFSSEISNRMENTTMDPNSPPQAFARLLGSEFVIPDEIAKALERVEAQVYCKPEFEDFEASWLPTYLLPKALVYCGQWRRGKRSGRGRQLWPCGALYQGYWTDNEIFGYGMLVHASGDIYIGEWQSGKANGSGTFIAGNGITSYTGEWRDHLQHGLGTEIYADGSKYFGYFEDGKRCGKGKLELVGGASFVGSFEENEFSDGVYKWANGKVYTGKWKSNKFHGKGFLKLPSGKHLKGQFANGHLNGHGEIRETSGTTFKGKYVNGKLEGPGIMVDSFGNVREGEWLNGGVTSWK